VTNGWKTDKRMEDSESLNPLTPLTTCGGLWVSAGVAVGGEERMKDEL